MVIPSLAGMSYLFNYKYFVTEFIEFGENIEGKPNHVMTNSLTHQFDFVCTRKQNDWIEININGFHITVI